MTNEPVTQMDAFKLDRRLTETLDQVNITVPTPIQEALIPVLMQGHNAVASAQTGSGKTLAYLLPALHRFADATHHYPKVLVLAPTKELAGQIFSVVKPLAKAVGLRAVLVQGGGLRAQECNRLRKGADIVVATPQRAEVYANEGVLDAKAVRYFIVDEADMMLDMGFTPLVLALMPRSSKVQKVLVSATVTRRVMDFAQRNIAPFRRIELARHNEIAPTVSHLLYPTVKSKKALLTMRLIEENGWRKVLVFVRKKEEAHHAFESLRTLGAACELLHGDRTHEERARSLRRFKQGDVTLLVATDVMARGLDIDDVEAVINYDVPHVKHDYIHRVGRTGRAGKEGVAVSLVSAEEIEQLADLVDLLGEKPKEVILPDFAPKLVKARGWLVMPPRRKKQAVKSALRPPKDPRNPRGKKRKTTKRDRRF